MGLVFGIGLVFAAIAAALVVRAFVVVRSRAAVTVDNIGSYGFDAGRLAADRAEAAEAAAKVARRPLSHALGAFSTLVGSRLAPRLAVRNEQELRRRLLAAGMYTTSPAKLFGVRVLTTALLPLLWLWVSVSSGKSAIVVLVGTVLAIFMGWALPIAYIQRRAKQRLQKIDYAMPDLIDTLVATVEAGVAFAASLQVAAQRFSGPLAEELQLMMQEQNMGLGLHDALTNLLQRADTPAMRSFVRSVIQGELLGVSISDSLRSLATEMRQRRRAAAEERAQKAPVKMLFPLMFLIFPAMFIVLLGPAVFKIHDLFSGGG
jgi:tight adherence protein C